MAVSDHGLKIYAYVRICSDKFVYVRLTGKIFNCKDVKALRSEPDWLQGRRVAAIGGKSDGGCSSHAWFRLDFAWREHRILLR